MKSRQHSVTVDVTFLEEVTPAEAARYVNSFLKPSGADLPPVLRGLLQRTSRLPITIAAREEN